MDQNPNTITNASTRSWLEMNVRPSLIIFLLMSAVILGMGTYQFRSGMNERWLIESGTPIPAKVLQIGLNKDRKVPRDEPVLVKLQYVDPKSGKTYENVGSIPRKPNSQVALEDKLTIRIDPNNPDNWTERTTPVPIMLDLTLSLILLPIIPITLWLTWRQRSRVLRVLSTGQIKKATIASIKHSSIAPMSSIIGFAVEGADRTVRYAYWPKTNGEVAVNSQIDVIDNGTGLSLPSRSYQA